jgi:hypothetical protein
VSHRPSSASSFKAISDLNTARQALDAGGSVADYADVAARVLPVARNFLGTSTRFGSLSAEIAQVVADKGGDPANLAGAIQSQSRAIAGAGEMQAALLGANMQELQQMRAEIVRLRENQDRMLAVIEATISRDAA